MKSLRLVLFFTRNVSLRTWAQMGMLEREVALYRALQARGVQISFITYGDADDLAYASAIPGIQILCNHRRLPPRVYHLLIPVLHVAALRRCDVIKTNQINGAEVALLAARLWHKPLIARAGYMWSFNTARAGGEKSLAARRTRFIEAQVFRAADRITVTTSRIATDITRRFPQVVGRLRVLPNYVETNRFRPDNTIHRDFDVIFVGRFSPEKNLEVLLEALRGTDITVLLIGSGPLEDVLRQRFADLNDQVQWQGSVPNHELPAYFNRAKVFVLPSRYEGHPKALIEAMACGLAVLGNDTQGIQDVIRHGETGWLCDATSQHIQNALLTLLHNPQLRATLGNNARRFVQQNYALDTIVEMELAMLREVAVDETSR